MLLGDNYRFCFVTYNSIIDGWKFQWEFKLLHCKFYIECGPVSLLRIQNEHPKPPQLA